MKRPIPSGLLIWICEGTKRSHRQVELVNHDPMIIQTFLAYLRSLGVDEKRLRGRLQASAKEDIQNEINKWSAITGIPKSQFIKPVIKRHEGRRKSSGVIIRYSSAELRRKLIKEAKKFGFLSQYSSIG